MSHWPAHVRRWDLVGPPLRPSAIDVGFVADELAAWQRRHGRPPRVLILGVTPELFAAAPAGATVIGIERVPAIVATLFVSAPGHHALAGDWRALPLAARSIDVAIGDGSLSNLAYPDGYRALAAELARVLAPDGRVVLRLFAGPPVAESLAAVGQALAAGAIGSFHALKWRVAMAVQPAGRNVRVADIRAGVDAIAPDRAALARATGWPAPVIAGIDVYRDSPITYSFPTVDEALAALAPLRPGERRSPSYELGDRCPTVILAGSC